MRNHLLLLGGLALLISCTGASSDPVPTSTPGTETPVTPGASARVTITQVRYGGPFFTEGSVSYVTLRHEDEVVLREGFRNPPMFRPLIDNRSVQPGRYRVISYQRPCDGSSLALDPPRARCSSTLDLHADDEVVVIVELRLPNRCRLKVEPGAVVAVSYPFQLYTHCGIGPTFFDGRTWVPRGKEGQEGLNSPPGWGDPFEKGTMRLISEGSLEFTIRSGDTVRFRLPPPASDVAPAFCY